MTTSDLIQSSSDQARDLVQDLLKAPFPAETTPISLHPICILIRGDPVAALQLLLQTETLQLISTLPNAIRSHILLILHHTLASVQQSTTTDLQLKSFASAALQSNQIATFALILSRLPEPDRHEIIRDMNVVDISKDEIVSWLNAFSESPRSLCPSLICILHQAVMNVYQHLSAHDYIPLVQNLLQLIPHVQRSDASKSQSWVQLVRNVFQVCPPVSLSDLTFITETALSYQPDLYDIIYQYFQQVECLTSPDIMVLMCLCCSRPYIDPVLSPVFKLISAKRHSIQVWKDVIRSQGNRAALLNSWSEIWMEDSGDLGQIGSAILHCLFQDVEHSRHEILQLVLTNITEYGGSKRIQDRFISLLAKLPLQHLTMFTSTIVDFIRYSGNLEPEPAKRVLSILLPIVTLSGSALDQFILGFRKFIHSRVALERSLGAFGLCELLRTAASSLSLSVQLEIVSSIDSSLNLPVQQRSMIYTSLRLALSSPTLRLHQECYNALFKILDFRIRRWMTSEKGQCWFQLKDYVYIQDDNVQYHDNLPELIACHTLTIPHVLPKPTFRIFDLIFANPSKLLATVSQPNRQQLDRKNLLLALTFAGSCETLSELIQQDESIVKFMTTNDKLSSDDLCIYLIELSSYLHQSVSDLARTDSISKRLIAKCPDAISLSAEFCLQMLSDEIISLLPLSRLLTALHAAISKPTTNESNLADRPSSSSSSSSSAMNPGNPMSILRACIPLFIKSLPWSDHQPNNCSSLFKSVAGRCNLPIRDSIPSYRHLLLKLIASSVSSVRSFLQLTRICEFPLCPDLCDENLSELDDPIDMMVMSWCYAFQWEFPANLEVPLGIAYVHLIQAATNHISALARGHAAKIILDLLGSYRISNAALIKAMVQLVVSLYPDQAKKLLKHPDQILLESDSCRAAAYDAILTSFIDSLNQCWNGMKSYTSKKLVITEQIFQYMQKVSVQSYHELERCLDLSLTIITAGDDHDVLISDRLISRFMVLINKMFMVGHSLISLLSRLITAVDQDILSDDLDCLSEIDSCLVFISKFVKSIESISDWITTHRESISNNLLSTTIFRISTFEHDVAVMVRKQRGSVASDRLEAIGDQLRRIADRHDNHRGQANISVKTRKRPRGGRKQQHRSRIAYIDEALLEEEGYASDAYADLEDWIVD